jgi:hypothetical protein
MPGKEILNGKDNLSQWKSDISSFIIAVRMTEATKLGESRASMINGNEL